MARYDTLSRVQVYKIINILGENQMTNCKYCFTECRTLWNKTTQTCSRCQDNYTRQTRYLKLKSHNPTSPKINSSSRKLDAKNVSGTIEDFEMRLEAAQARSKKSFEDAEKAQLDLQKFLDDLTK